MQPNLDSTGETNPRLRRFRKIVAIDLPNSRMFVEGEGWVECKRGEKRQRDKKGKERKRQSDAKKAQKAEEHKRRVLKADVRTTCRGKERDEAKRPKPVCKLNEEGIEPHPGPEHICIDNLAEDQQLLETANITAINTSNAYILRRRTDYMAIQEHKRAASTLDTLTSAYAKDGWTMLPSPPYPDSAVPAGGGGIDGQATAHHG